MVRSTSQVTSKDAVLRAIDEYERLGSEVIRERYGFADAKQYYLHHQGKRYPSKAIMGLAFGMQYPDEGPLRNNEFSGGIAQVVNKLRSLGFEIIDQPEQIPRAPQPPEGQMPKPSQWIETADGSEVRSPTNLILYGPPGTGKTYTTALEAVRLCDGLTEEDVTTIYPASPNGRAALMDRYRELQNDERRIEFVTFHQSYSYEDFVEGLRPVPLINDEGTSSGFQLEPVPGVFQRIAERAAATAMPHGKDWFSLEGRSIYKMALGQTGSPDGDWVYEESIENGYALFSFGCIDWSDPRFADPAEILHEAQARSPGQAITPSHGVVKCTHIFRNLLKVGDVLVVSKGLSQFRAIGVVEGDYEFAPKAEGNYCHRRKVRWLWQDPTCVSVPDISDTNFNMSTIHSLRKQKLILPVLERYANSADEDTMIDIEADNWRGMPEPNRRVGSRFPVLPHVLIIDEINRANISKVFGELITLIEPDKRLGQDNALTLTLPYSHKVFGVPANLHIVGTMNTADRSIALLDTALRRRFTFREIAPQPNLLTTIGGIDLSAVLTTINDRIEYLIDREHRIGHAFFIGCRDGADVDAAMRDKLIPLLQEYFFEDWSRIHAVLGNGFIGQRKLKAPPGIEGEERASWFVKSRFPADAYQQLFKASLGSDSSAANDEDDPGKDTAE